MTKNVGNDSAEDTFTLAGVELAEHYLDDAVMQLIESGQSVNSSILLHLADTAAQIAIAQQLTRIANALESATRMYGNSTI